MGRAWMKVKTKPSGTLSVTLKPTAGVVLSGGNIVAIPSVKQRAEAALAVALKPHADPKVVIKPQAIVGFKGRY